MSCLGTKIVKEAVKQLGKHDQGSSCPRGGCYSGRGKNWCSEFVSWVYNAAGVPFTGGRDGGWLLVDTGKIRRWFKSKSAYIDRGDPDWNKFVPSPGDYVFIGRVSKPSRKHSGVVERICGKDLLTIEGNNKNRKVARYIYPNFRTNDKKDDPSNTDGYVIGFGIK